MKKKLIIIIPILIAIIAFVFVYRYYNKEDKTTTLTVTEKKWVQDNAKTAVDFEIINDYPLYGMNGVAIGTLIAMTVRTIEFMYHSSRYILKRNQISSYMRLVVVIIETSIIALIINFIIRDVNFNAYSIWIKYAIISGIFACIITLVINCLLYKKDTKGVIKILKNNLKKGAN